RRHAQSDAAAGTIMRQVRRVARVVALFTLLTPALASAQDRFDVGAHVAVARSSEFDDTDTGVGGRFSWHPVALVGGDAEMRFYPASLSEADGFTRRL